MDDLEHMLNKAIHEIRALRHRNEVLAGQVFVVEAFHAASLGAPRGGQGMAPDVTWEMQNYLEKRALLGDPKGPEKYGE